MKLPTAYRKDWYIIVKEVCDRKLVAKNREQHTASTSGECKNLSEVSAAGWNKWGDKATLTTSEQQSWPEIGPDIGKEIAHVIGPEFWQGSEQVIEPEFQQVLGPQFRQVIGPELYLVTRPKFWEEIDQALKQESEQVKRTTVFVPNSVEGESASHKRQFGAPNIAGEHTFGDSGSSPWTSNDSNLLESLMSQSMPTRKISGISIASNKEGDAEQLNHPKTSYVLLSHSCPQRGLEPVIL